MPSRRSSSVRIASRSNQTLLVEAYLCRLRSVRSSRSSGSVCAVSRSTIRPSLTRVAKCPPLLVAGGAAHGLDRERCPGLREPAGHTRVGDGAEVVGVGHEHPLEAGVDQLVEQAGAAERGVEVAVTGRTPLERRGRSASSPARGRRPGAWAPCSAGTPAAALRPRGPGSAPAPRGCRRRCGSEFMKISGSGAPYSLRRCSTWRAMMSRNDRPRRTHSRDLARSMPIEVPRPPLSLITTVVRIASEAVSSGTSTSARDSISIGSMEDSGIIPGLTVLDQPVVVGERRRSPSRRRRHPPSSGGTSSGPCRCIRGPEGGVSAVSDFVRWFSCFRS